MNDTFNSTETPFDTTAGREFVLRAAKTVKERAASLHEGAEKATSELETALATSAAKVGEAARAVQGAVYKDVEAALATVEKLANAKSLSEAAQVQAEFLSRHSQVSLERFKSASEYFAKAMQDNIAKMSERFSKAA